MSKMIPESARKIIAELRVAYEELLAEKIILQTENKKLRKDIKDEPK